MAADRSGVGGKELRGWGVGLQWGTHISNHKQEAERTGHGVTCLRSQTADFGILSSCPTLPPLPQRQVGEFKPIRTSWWQALVEGGGVA